MRPETVIAFGIGCICVLEVANLFTLGYDGTILSGCIGAISYLCGLLHGKHKRPKKVRRRRKNVQASQTDSIPIAFSVQS
jgi:hypothetical protein